MCGIVSSALGSYMSEVYEQSCLLVLVRVFYGLISLRLRVAVKRRLTRQEQLTRCSPVEKDVFRIISVFRTKATLDDCDWNGHLSNSSYAKV